MWAKGTDGTEWGLIWAKDAEKYEKIVKLI